MPAVSRRCIAWTILFILSFLATDSGWCEAPVTLQAVVDRIQSFYRSSGGIVAEFTQVLESRTLPRPQEETGMVYLKAPGRMRWEYSRPKGKLAISDGSKVFLYLPEDREVLVGSVKDLDAGAVATRLLLGEASLSSEFRVEGEPASDREGVWSLRLVPQVNGFPYDSLTLEVEARNGAIRRIGMLDPLGNRMEYRFDAIRTDRNLSEKLFTYSIPRGVEIQTFGGGKDSQRPSP